MTDTNVQRPIRFGFYEQAGVGFGYGSPNLWRHAQDERLQSFGFDFWVRSARQNDADVLSVQPHADGSAYNEYMLTPNGAELFHLVVKRRECFADNAFDAT